MIKDIQDAIIAQIQTITTLKTVDAWQGDIDDLIRTPQKLPAVRVIYQGGTFGEPEVISVNLAPHDMTFLIVLINKNLRSAKEGAEDCYEVIESIRSKLIGLDVGSSYGLLWPVKEDLIFSAAGVLAYGLEYKISTRVEGV